MNWRKILFWVWLGLLIALVVAGSIYVYLYEGLRYVNNIINDIGREFHGNIIVRPTGTYLTQLNLLYTYGRVVTLIWIGLLILGIVIAMFHEFKLGGVTVCVSVILLFIVLGLVFLPWNLYISYNGVAGSLTSASPLIICNETVGTVPITCGTICHASLLGWVTCSQIGKFGVNYLSNMFNMSPSIITRLVYILNNSRILSNCIREIYHDKYIIIYTVNASCIFHKVTYYIKLLKQKHIIFRDCLETSNNLTSYFNCVRQVSSLVDR